MPKSGSYYYPGYNGTSNPNLQGPVASVGTLREDWLTTYGNVLTFFSETLNASQGQKINILFKTPPNIDGKFLRLSFNVTVDSQARVVFYEGPTVTSSGSDLTLFNINRISNNSIADLNAYGTSVITNSGTALSIFHVGFSGSGGQRQ